MRAWGLGAWWLHPDEGIYLLLASTEKPEIFWAGIRENAHPPVYYLLLRAFAGVTTNFVALRILSLVSGVAVVLGVAFFAGAIVGGSARTRRVTGLLAGLLVALSPGFVVLSQVLRPYALLVACQMFSAFFLARYFVTRSPGNLAGFSLLACLAILVHYSGVLALGAAGLALAAELLERRSGSRELVDGALALIMPAALFGALYFSHVRPQLVESGMQAEVFQGWLGPFLIDSPRDVVPRLLGVMSLLFGRELAGVGTILTLAGLVLAVITRRLSLAAWTLGALAIAIVASAAGRYPLGWSRHSAWLLGPLAVLPCYALALALTRGARLAALCGAAVLGMAALAGPIDALLGVPPPVAKLSEQRVGREDVARVIEWLGASGHPTPLLVSDSVYLQLIPDFGLPSEFWPGQSFWVVPRFRWQGYEVFKADVWDFRLARDLRGEADDLRRYIERIDSRAGGAKLANAPRITMLVDDPTPEFRRLLRDGSGPATEVLCVAKLCVFELDLASLLAR